MTTQPPPSTHMAHSRLNRRFGRETTKFSFGVCLDKGGQKETCSFGRLLTRFFFFFFPPFFPSFFSMVFLIWDGLQKTSGTLGGAWEKNWFAYRLLDFCFHFVCTNLHNCIPQGWPFLLISSFLTVLGAGRAKDMSATLSYFFIPPPCQNKAMAMVDCHQLHFFIYHPLAFRFLKFFVLEA
ncbi:hypothetical protein CH063_10482 [Colletotrichum higginsianum]|uniref:Uncharacterized protein n=1 Tax=Colletotrichum higginsianum (strain IMI 349063) TaxID=759273 RepID=H1VHL8_COLHI|nr:hypothetical protein CH063_10482 [Colletotrichum higginsianum]